MQSSKYPNRFYVPMSADSNIRVFELQADNSLTLIDVIHTGYPSDNLTVDEDDNIYTASFPNVPKLLAKFKDPFNTHSPSTVLKVSKNEGKDKFYGKKWNVEKVLEDDGTGMSGATTALWDSEKKGFWLGGTLWLRALDGIESFLLRRGALTTLLPFVFCCARWCRCVHRRHEHHHLLQGLTLTSTPLSPSTRLQVLITSAGIPSKATLARARPPFGTR